MSLFYSVKDLIYDLERSIPQDGDELLLHKFRRNDWRPVWDLCKLIQNRFNQNNEFESCAEQNAAWTRFQNARKEASRLFDLEKKQFALQSSGIRRDIFYAIKYCYYSASADFFVGSFLGGETTVEEIKAMQRRLKEAGQMLSKNKYYMTGEDKQKCFDAILQARESHDHFWNKYREFKRLQVEKKRVAYESKKKAWQGRVKENIKNNVLKLENAEGAYNKSLSRIEGIKDKIADTKSEKWISIYSEWLDKEIDKNNDIQNHINRILSWISEDEDKLNNS